MRIERKLNITINETVFDWTFMLLPTIFMKRTTSHWPSENVVIIAFQWLVFQFLLYFKTEREQTPLGK